MISNDTVALPVTPRDVQFLVTMGVAYSTYINWLTGRAPEEAMDSNDRALDRLFVTEFSSSEFNALMERLKDALPPDTSLKFRAPSGESYVH